MEVTMLLQKDTRAKPPCDIQDVIGTPKTTDHSAHNELPIRAYVQVITSKHLRSQFHLKQEQNV